MLASSWSQVMRVKNITQYYRLSSSGNTIQWEFVWIKTAFFFSFITNFFSFITNFFSFITKALSISRLMIVSCEARPCVIDECVIYT